MTSTCKVCGEDISQGNIHVSKYQCHCGSFAFMNETNTCADCGRKEGSSQNKGEGINPLRNILNSSGLGDIL